MVSNPKSGTRVRINYRKKLREVMPFHGRTGTVEIPGRGKPRNHGVRLDQCNTMVVVPAGNLVPE